MPPPSDAAQAMIAGHEDRIQHVEQEITRISSDSAASASSMKAMHHRMDDLQEFMGSKLDALADRVSEKVDEVGHAVAKINDSTASHGERLAKLEDRGTRRDQLKTWALGLIGAAFLSLFGAVVAHYIPSGDDDKKDPVAAVEHTDLAPPTAPLGSASGSSVDHIPAAASSPLVP